MVFEGVNIGIRIHKPNIMPTSSFTSKYVLCGRYCGL